MLSLQAYNTYNANRFPAIANRALPRFQRKEDTLISLSETTAADPRWQGLDKMGGVAALIIAVLLLGEIVVYASFPQPATVHAHFALFHDNWLLGLLTLDRLGMIAYLLFIPTILALYLALRPTNESVMLVATVLFFVGIADFFATNTAFSVLALSTQYAAATSATERATLLAAGQAMFTLFNENAFLVSYVLVSAAWTLMAGVMRRSPRFDRRTAYAGILAGGAGIATVILEPIATLGAFFVLAIALYFAALVFLFIWMEDVLKEVVQDSSSTSAISTQRVATRSARCPSVELPYCGRPGDAWGSTEPHGGLPAPLPA